MDLETPDINEDIRSEPTQLALEHEDSLDVSVSPNVTGSGLIDTEQVETMEEDYIPPEAEPMETMGKGTMTMSFVLGFLLLTLVLV